MADKLFELDPTSFTTGARNWLSRKRDAALAAAGNGRAFGRHTTRLVANKLYRAWKVYLGQQGKQGTNAELAHFVNQFFGPERLSELSQSFPQVLPASSPPASQVAQQQQQTQAPNPPAQAAAPVQAPVQPAAPVAQPATAPAQAPVQQQVPDDHASMQRLQSYMHRLQPLLATATPNPPAVMRTVGAMLRDFSGRSEKAKTWVRSYIANNLSGYSNVIPDLAQFANQDPFSFVQTRRSRTGAQAPVAPVASTPTESRRIAGRLVEADPSLDIQPPGGAPPAFMQQQRSMVVLNRKLTDQIMVALARILIASGDAGRSQDNGGAQPQRSNTAAQASGGGARRDVMHTQITRAAFDQASRTTRISPRDYQKVVALIQQNGGAVPMNKIMTELGKTIDQSTVQALMYASQYGRH